MCTYACVYGVCGGAIVHVLDVLMTSMRCQWSMCLGGGRCDLGSNAPPVGKFFSDGQASLWARLYGWADAPVSKAFRMGSWWLGTLQQA